MGPLKSYYPYIASLLFVICLHSVNAQKLFTAGKFKFEHFDQYDGLADGESNTVFQDSRGYLWIGCRDGVSIYDGYKFTSFKGYLTGSSNFRGNVTSIAEDQKGDIWIGTRSHGIYIFRYSTGKFEKIKLQDSATINPVMSLYKDKDGRFWVGDNDGLYQYSETEKFIPYPVTGVLNIYENRDNLYVQTKNAIYTPDVARKSFDTVLNLEDISLSVGGTMGKMWVAAEDSLFLYDATWKIVKSFRSPENEEVLCVFENDDRVWIGTSRGLWQIDMSENWKLEKSFGFPGISDITKDHAGNLFLSTMGRGLLKYAWNADQYNYIPLSGVGNNYIRGEIIEENDGTYWMSSDAGLIRYHPRTEAIFIYKHNPNDKHSLPSNHVWDIAKGPNGDLWIATRSGLCRYDPTLDRFDRIQMPETGPKNQIRSLTFQDAQILWFTAQEQLNRLDLKTMAIKNSWPEKLEVSSFFISDTTLWAYDKNKGLSKFTIAENELKVDKVYSELKEEWGLGNWIIPDDQGRIWLGVATRGVYLFDISREMIVDHLYQDNLLLDDNLTFMYKDNKNQMWLQQPVSGIAKIDATTLAITRRATKMLYNNVHKKYATIASVGKDGRLFTDGVGGIFSFFEDSIKKNEVPPIIYLESLMIGDSIVQGNGLDQKTGHVELDHIQNNLSLQFVGLHFVDPENNQYAFQLSGLNNDWINSGDQMVARYQGLTPSDYEFKVKASNSDGVWSEPVTLLRFTINRPWWQTNLAYLLYALIFSIIIYFVYKSQLNRRLAISEASRLKVVDEFKNRFFTNITHEFRTPLTVILGLASKLETEAGVLITRNGRQLLTLINQLLELGRIESNKARLTLQQGDVISYLRYITESFESMAKDRKIELTFQTDVKELYMDYDKEKLLLIVNNLLSNALKFTQERGQVSVLVDHNESWLNISVNDNGVGIPEENIDRVFDRYFQVDDQSTKHEGAGIGLALTSELVKLMDGEVAVDSIMGTGSTFSVRLPITRNAPVDAVELTKKPGSIPHIYPLNEEAEGVEDDDKKYSVLVIEDNQDVRHYIQSVLQPDYHVLLAKNGKLGVETAIEVIPDLIVSDVMMPEKDGLQVCNELKNDQRTSHIPIVLLTAKANLDAKLSGLKKGADAYLTKPFSEEELLVRMENLVHVREQLKERYSNALSNVGKPGQTIEDVFIQRIHQVVLDHLSDDTYGIEEVCAEMAISRTQLHRKLKALTGKSASLFIRDIRLEESKKLITTTSLTISEIAYEVGFADPNYFTRLYSEKYHRTPSKDRQTHNLTT